MLTFEEFKRSPRCRPLVLADEDQPQDSRDWRVLERADQERQYQLYANQFEPEENGSCATEKVVLPVVQPKMKKGKKDAAWWREYRLRNKVKYCPHCKKQL